MRKMQRAATGGSRQRRGPPSASAGKSNPNGEPAYFASDPDRSAAAAVARYVALLSGEMAVMARSANLDMLTYLLDMAQAEAELIARTPPGGGADATNPAP